jgi:hypothetical protein
VPTPEWNTRGRAATHTSISTDGTSRRLRGHANFNRKNRGGENLPTGSAGSRRRLQRGAKSGLNPKYWHSPRGGAPSNPRGGRAVVEPKVPSGCAERAHKHSQRWLQAGVMPRRVPVTSASVRTTATKGRGVTGGRRNVHHTASARGRQAPGTRHRGVAHALELVSTRSHRSTKANLPNNEARTGYRRILTAAAGLAKCRQSNVPP